MCVYNVCSLHNKPCWLLLFYWAYISQFCHLLPPILAINIQILACSSCSGCLTKGARPLKLIVASPSPTSLVRSDSWCSITCGHRCRWLAHLFSTLALHVQLVYHCLLTIWCRLSPPWVLYAVNEDFYFVLYLKFKLCFCGSTNSCALSALFSHKHYIHFAPCAAISTAPPPGVCQRHPGWWMTLSQHCLCYGKWKSKILELLPELEVREILPVETPVFMTNVSKENYPRFVKIYS